MKKISLLILSFCFPLMLGARHFTYTADPDTIFPNPERGFTEELSYVVSEVHPNVVKNCIGSNWKTRYNMSLIMVLYNFKNFKSTDIPEKVLKGFDEDMQELRDNGFKCVLRFAYTESQSEKVDATPDWVKRHLEQLKPHLEANADVIYVIEAGFIGSWGEWYYTTNYGNETQHMNANRRKVIDYLFANVPEDRFVLFRYPMIKTEYLNDPNPLTAEEGFTKTVKARMGCHNDAFLNDWGNDGTYASDDKSDDPKVRQYVATETLYVPNGGETNVESKSKAEKVYSQAPEEMSTYHWSFCGKSYSTAVTNKWRDSGIFDELNRKMGYRYELVSAEIPFGVGQGTETPFEFVIKNVGYAPLYNERPVFLVFKNGDKSYPVRLKTDPRRWLPNGETTVIKENVLIPADMPNGEYELYLHMPDAYSSLASDPRFAIRFANKDTWDATTGMNSLMCSMLVDENVEALSSTECPQPVRKVLRDGHLYILRGEQILIIL
ncbi:MAG: DUF4832 domain-containing protein [Paludibacteraceae bacterium]|nr:DUF4832 domain-containing protein [Paludibacteraceae bacterium]